MKKILLLAAAFVAAVSSNAQITFADDEDDAKDSIIIQDSRKSVLYLGLKVGGNYATMSKYQDVDLGQKGGVGFEAGAFIGMRFGKRTKASDPGTGPLSLQLELMYAKNVIKTNLDDNISLSYFQVPVMLKYYFFQNLNIEAGVAIAGLLSSKPDMLTANLNEPYPGRQSVSIATGDFKGFDIRPAVGLGYVVPKIGLGVGARYYFGTSNLAGNFPCKVSALEFALSWQFNVLKF